MKRTYPINALVVASTRESAEGLLAVLREARLTVRARLATDPGAVAEALAERSFDLVLVSLGRELQPLQRVAEQVRENARDAAVIGIADSVTTSAEAPPPDGVAAIVPRESPALLVHAAVRELRQLRERQALRASRRLLDEAQRAVHELMDGHPDPMAFVAHGTLLSANPAFRALFGFAPTAQIRGVPLAECIAESDREEVDSALAEALHDDARGVVLDLRGQHRDGACFALGLELTPMTIDRRRGVRAVARAHARADAGPDRSPQPVQRDPETGLWSRDALLAELASRPAEADAAARASLVFLEIENYVQIKHGAGLGVAEEVATEAARRLRAALPPDAVAARVADDGFAVLVGAEEAPARVASRLAAALGEGPYELRSRTVLIGCRSGTVDVAAASGMALLDRALAEARRPKAASSGIAVRDDPIHDDTTDGADVAAELRGAIEEGRLFPIFQPIVRLHGESIELYEAFLRLHARDGTLIPPGVFFPVAESEGLSVAIDRYLIERLCGVLAERNAAGAATHLFVKLSAASMREAEIPIGIGRQLRGSGVPPQRLIVEIAESTASADVRTARAFMRSLHQVGCATAIEHFGVSFKSFELLDQVPADYVKIDATLVEGLARDADLRARVAAIASKVHEHGRHTIAENLEDPASLAALFACGIEFAQGYYIQEPSASLDFAFDIELA